jgi:hypothetical protein
MEKQGIGTCSLARNTSGVEGCARILGWGLGRMSKGSIIHMAQTKQQVD